MISFMALNLDYININISKKYKSFIKFAILLVLFLVSKIKTKDADAFVPHEKEISRLYLFLSGRDVIFNPVDETIFPSEPNFA